MRRSSWQEDMGACGRVPHAIGVRESEPMGDPDGRVGDPDGRVSPDEVRDVIQSILVGIIIALSLIIVLLLSSMLFPMLGRRYEMESSEATGRGDAAVTTPDGTPIPMTGASIRLPQISWDLILTDEERANREALRDDIAEMGDDPSFNVFAWPVLPYPVGTWCGEDRFEKLTRLVSFVYNDEPELSVYTDGQSLCANVAVSKYRLIDAESDDSEDNRKEYERVVRAANRLHADIERQMSQGGSLLWPRTCNSDETYVALLYEKLTSMTSYADDTDDTNHANDIYGALLEDESKCYGVASAAKALLNRRGIPSFMASGSMDGDDSKRHAWVVMWIGGQWKTLDITHSQGASPPDVINVDEATTGAPGYWGGCMRPFDEFVSAQNMKVDDDCIELMRAYEREIGATGNPQRGD